MWEKGNTVETVVLLSHKKPDSRINVKAEFGDENGKFPIVEASLCRLCKDLLTTRVDSENRTGVCSYAIFQSGGKFQLYGRPYVGMLSSGIRIFDVATLSHENDPRARYPTDSNYRFYD